MSIRHPNRPTGTNLKLESTLLLSKTPQRRDRVHRIFKIGKLPKKPYPSVKFVPVGRFGGLVGYINPPKQAREAGEAQGANAVAWNFGLIWGKWDKHANAGQTHSTALFSNQSAGLLVRPSIRVIWLALC
jgi:hypothetical protein